LKFTINISRTKTLSILLALSMLLGSVGWIQYGNALTASPPWTLNYPLPSTASFVVNQYSNGTYYAVSGDGQTYYYSTNASHVIQSALDNGQNNTHLSLGNAIYQSVHVHIQYHNVVITGISMAGVILDGTTTTVFQILPLSYDGWYFRGPQISDMTFLGSTGGFAAIDTSAITDTDKGITMLKIDKCAFTGYDNANVPALIIKNPEDISVTNCQFDNGNGNADNTAICKVYTTDYNGGKIEFKSNYWNIYGDNNTGVLVVCGLKETNTAFKGLGGITFIDEKYYTDISGDIKIFGVKLIAAGEGIGYTTLINCRFERSLLLAQSNGTGARITFTNIESSSFNMAGLTNAVAMNFSGGYTQGSEVFAVSVYSDSATNIAVSSGNFGGNPTIVRDLCAEGTFLYVVQNSGGSLRAYGQGFEVYGNNITAANGGTQNFDGLYNDSPSYWNLVAYVTSGNSTAIICGVTSVTYNSFVYSLKSDAGAAVTGQTVHWCVRYIP
jgi:hypothetical protein